MSLYSFIRNRVDVQHGFAARLMRPRFRFERTLQAPPLTTNYQMVDSAFGYLLRFRLQRINPQASVSAWPAEVGVERIGVAHEDIGGKDVLTPSRHPRELRAAAYIADAKRRYQAYTEDGQITHELLLAAYRLAHLDLAIHAGADGVDWRSINYLRADDAADLRVLLELVDEQAFRAQRFCMIHPRLPASELVGGADPVCILDDCVVDVSMAHKPAFDLRDLYRLVGYFLLLGLGGVIDGNGNRRQHGVSAVGMYFARFGQLWKAPVREILSPLSMPEITKWFVESAAGPGRHLPGSPDAFDGPLAAHLSGEEGREKREGRRMRDEG